MLTAAVFQLTQTVSAAAVDALEQCLHMPDDVCLSALPANAYSTHAQQPARHWQTALLQHKPKPTVGRSCADSAYAGRQLINISKAASVAWSLGGPLTVLVPGDYW